MNRPLLFAVVLVAGGTACCDLSKESSKREAKQDAPCLPERYVPVGNNPDIALDTQTGSLCRTVVYASAARGGIAPQVGAIVDGYRFKGGDPSDKANWEQTAAPDPDKYAGLPACEAHQSFSEWKKSQGTKKWNAVKGVYE